MANAYQRTVPSSKHNIFLALREKDGVIYTCQDKAERKKHKKLWDKVNYILDMRRRHHLLYTIFLKLPYVLYYRHQDGKIFRRWHKQIENED